MPSSCRTSANFFGSTRRRSVIIAGKATRPASVKTGVESSPGYQPHEAMRDQPLRCRRQLRLACIGAPAPGLKVKTLGNAWQCRKEDVQFAANVVPFAGCEPGDHAILPLVHARNIARSDLGEQSRMR